MKVQARDQIFQIREKNEKIYKNLFKSAGSKMSSDLYEIIPQRLK